MRGNFQLNAVSTQPFTVAAEHAFGRRGLVEMTYLTGLYHIVCGLLNAFEIPAPGS